MSWKRLTVHQLSFVQNFLRIERMYRVPRHNKPYLSIKVPKDLFAGLFATAVFTDITETQVNLIAATIYCLFFFFFFFVFFFCEKQTVSDNS